MELIKLTLNIQDSGQGVMQIKDPTKKETLFLLLTEKQCRDIDNYFNEDVGVDYLKRPGLGIELIDKG